MTSCPSNNHHLPRSLSRLHHSDSIQEIFASFYEYDPCIQYLVTIYWLLSIYLPMHLKCQILNMSHMYNIYTHILTLYFLINFLLKDNALENFAVFCQTST